MKPREELLALAERGVKRALARGADAAEVYVSEARNTSITALGMYASPKETLSDGVAVRISLGGRVGLSGATNFAQLDAVIEQALTGLRDIPGGGRSVAFARPTGAPPRPIPIHPDLREGDLARISEAAEAVNRHMLEPEDVTYASTTLTTWRHQVAVANSLGVLVADESAGERLEVGARVTRGSREVSASGTANGTQPLKVDLEALADATMERARGALDAKPLDGAAEQVLLHPAPASQILRLFGDALSGNAAAAGQSPLSGRLDDEVVNPLVTLRDLPKGPGGARHRTYDDEGTPTRDTTLVDKGRLAGFLHDATSAERVSVEPTGNAVRKSVQGGIAIRPINLSMDAGDHTLAELIEAADRAVLVTEPLMGAFVANDVTGDFSLVAPFAFLVENGEIRHALPPTTVGGNAHRLLQEVRAVGRDRHTFNPGTFPALLAGGVSCAT